jgi:AcrR family transcriptional regulator
MPHLMNGMRVVPLQARALRSVQMLLAATRRPMLRDGVRRLMVDAVAVEAGMTPQAAYRYFASPGDLLRALVRQHQVGRFQQFRSILASASLTSEADLVRIGAQFVTRGFFTAAAVPEAIKLHLLRHYHDVAYDEIWLIAGEVRDAMRRAGSVSGYLPEQSVVAAAFAGMVSAAKIVALHDLPSLRSERFEATMAGMLQGALRGLTPLPRDAVPDDPPLVTELDQTDDGTGSEPVRLARVAGRRGG